MGLFDYFKKKTESDAELPRVDHYVFAHVALRQFAFGSPYMCLGALASPQAQRIIQELLESVADYCQAEGQEMTLAPEQFRTHALKAKKSPCLIVEMPPPRAIPEAYMVGIVIKPSAGDTAAALADTEVRYFTLEFGEGEGTVLCEWTHDSRHLNHGAGPVPKVDKFLKAIADLCG